MLGLTTEDPAPRYTLSARWVFHPNVNIRVIAKHLLIDATHRKLFNGAPALCDALVRETDVEAAKDLLMTSVKLASGARADLKAVIVDGLRRYATANALKSEAQQTVQLAQHYLQKLQQP